MGAAFWLCGAGGVQFARRSYGSAFYAPRSLDVCDMGRRIGGGLRAVRIDKGGNGVAQAHAGGQGCGSGGQLGRALLELEYERQGTVL